MSVTCHPGPGLAAGPDPRRPRSAPTMLRRRTEMDLIQEDLARAHCASRLEEAQEIRRSYEIARARRIARKAEKAALRARLALARAL